MNVKEVAGREGNRKRGLELGTNERGSVSVGEKLFQPAMRLENERKAILMAVIANTVNKHQNWGRDRCLGRYRSYGHQNTNSANK